MALCDELDRRNKKVSINCIQLNDASIHKLLTAHETKKFNTHFQRIYDNFDLLYNKLANVNKLRQAILQLAVQGKLVPQNPNDEPASILLEKFRIKKERLAKGKKLKRGKPLTSINLNYVPYNLPIGWTWTLLGELILSMTNGIYKQARYYSDQGIGCLRMYNINDGKINFDNLKRMVLEDQELETYKLIEGDLLVNRVNSRELVGKTGVIGKYDEPLVFESKNIRVRLAESLTLPHYINILFRTSQVRKVFEGDAKQTCGQASISQPQISEILTPLPPLMEQEKIVIKVNQLMALCDELEFRLLKSQTDCDRLMEATVAEILAA
jgi:type I restriction enzyme S subunit